ncbi:hypothetical protein DQ384_13605 [Sphaerisporangium album]|uniref:Uncharacterized protein n=2 Tax=Sphaerisporangium album TaxID=509200 RepID=A0A367FL62_9ACTN|nr:hypothetical protein DQ384_13605 [Sphaerisporangium album]
MAGLACAAGCAVGQADQGLPGRPLENVTAPPLTSADTQRIGSGLTVSLTAGGPVPRQLVAGLGDTITWRNDSGGKVSVHLIDGTRPSGDIPPGGTFTHVFETVGSFAYRTSKDGEPVGFVEILPHAGQEPTPATPTR